jgi:hypothetical protein
VRRAPICASRKFRSVYASGKSGYLIKVLWAWYKRVWLGEMG